MNLASEWGAGGQRWGNWKSQKPGKRVQLQIKKKVGIGIQDPACPPGPEQSSTSPQSGGTEGQRQAGNAVEGALAGRSPEGSWLGWEREATPVATGTGQRPAEGDGSTRGLRERRPGRLCGSDRCPAPAPLEPLLIDITGQD